MHIHLRFVALIVRIDPMYAPPGFDSDSSGEETISPTRAPPSPSKKNPNLNSGRFSSRPKSWKRGYQDKQKDEEKEPPG